MCPKIRCDGESYKIFGILKELNTPLIAGGGNSFFFCTSGLQSKELIVETVHWRNNCRFVCGLKGPCQTVPAQHGSSRLLYDELCCILLLPTVSLQTWAVVWCCFREGKSLYYLNQLLTFAKIYFFLLEL
jgi:hypothetical protein